ncbi:MAG: hypothetical protein QM770_08385 [Tepidisphaeraceae bacterium]
MARRKRKATLFDVMNKGSGLTPPAYVNRPVRRDAYPAPRQGPGIGQVLTDWLARKLQPLTTNRPASTPPAGPRSARDEMDAMRRELAGPDAEPTPAPVAVVEPEPELDPEPAPVRRSALDALAAMRSELASSSDVVEGEEVEPARPIEVMPKKKPVRRQIENLETPDSPGPRDPQAARYTEIALEQVEPKQPRKPIGDVLKPYVSKITRTLKSAGAWSSRQLIAFKNRVNELLDRATTQNGHRLALGRYTPFIIGGAVVGIVVFAFVLGQVFNKRTPSQVELLAASNGDAVRSDVLDLTGAVKPAPAGPAQANVPAGNIDQRQSSPTLTRRAGKPLSSPETRGDNFIVVQSYTTDVDADAAVEVLTKYGIDCTVEKNIPRWTTPGQQKDRFYVVTLDGFASKGTVGPKPYARLADNPDYAATLNKLNQVNDAEFRKTLPSRLDPRPYKWEGRGS